MLCWFLFARKWHVALQGAEQMGRQAAFDLAITLTAQGAVSVKRVTILDIVLSKFYRVSCTT